MLTRVQLALCASLILLYGWIIVLVYSPNVAEEYRAYYIDRTTSDWRPLRYSATLDDGIDFSREGWPSFVEKAFGISHPEPWGRWTDARLARSARIVLSKPLAGPICIAIKFAPSDNQMGKPVLVRVGKMELKIVPDTSGAQWYRLDFAVLEPQSTIEIEPAAPARVSSGDPRVIGIGLYHLTVTQGGCIEGGG